MDNENEQNLSKRQRRELRKQQRTSDQQAKESKIKQKKTIKIVVGVIVAVVVVYVIFKLASSGDQVAAQDWVRGPANAPVTLIEYGDFQCPACASYFPVVQQLHEAFPSNLKIIFRHYPLTQIHPNAIPASIAAEAAGRQDKFWEMHDKLYTEQRIWSSGSTSELFEQYARDLNLDLDKFKADIDDSSINKKINIDQRSGNRDGVRGTPTFVLNGRRIDSPQGFEQFRQLIQAEIDDIPEDQKLSLEQSLISESVHEHADLKIILRDKELDLSQEKYQSTEEDHKHETLHLHDNEGGVIHKHQADVTVGEFLRSIGMSIDNECLILDDSTSFCNNDAENIKFFVNSNRIDDMANYEFQDLDRILISYGSEGEVAVQKQIESVGDEACIYSETCPERGEAPYESCVGGLGTNCEGVSEE